MPAIESSEEPRDDLLVDVHDLGPVQNILIDLKVTYAPIRDDRLGLVRLANLGLDGDVDKVFPIDADALAAILRRRAAAALDGWTPVIAVNRLDHAIVGDGLVMLESHKPMDRGEPEVP